MLAPYYRCAAEMVADSPWAFAVSEAEPESVVAERLCGPENVIAGAWDGPELGEWRGCIGTSIQNWAHRAHVWGVYVTPRRGGEVWRLHCWSG
jgi:hypothetical protein